MGGPFAFPGKGTQGVHARHDAVALLPPNVSIVRSPGRPVKSVPETWPLRSMQPVTRRQGSRGPV